MSLKKSDIVEAITERKFLSQKQAFNAVENLLQIIKSTLESGDDVMISGFGKFCVNEKAARKGRNPATDKPMMLPARKAVTFKCSGILRNKCQTPLKN